VTRVFIDPGDVVIAEAPSYVGALGTFAAYQAEVVHVAMDDQGLVPEALRETIAACRRRASARSSSTPSPTSTTRPARAWPSTGRDEVLAICQSAGLLVLEDNPYGLLGFDTPPVPAIRRAAARTTSSTSARSARPSPRAARRLGAGAARRAREARARRRGAVLCPPTFNQLAVAEYLVDAGLAGQVAAFRAMYRERRDAMLDALRSRCRRARPGPVRPAASTSG
jgi:DNA-binding transcriptional MocR family regulator